MGRFDWELRWQPESERELAERRMMLRRLRAAVVVAKGTGRMTQVHAEAPGAEDLKGLEALLCDALAREQYGEARLALRKLRAVDFKGYAEEAEACLGVVRDLRSSEEEVADAIRQLCSLARRE